MPLFVCFLEGSLLHIGCEIRDVHAGWRRHDRQTRLESFIFCFNQAKILIQRLRTCLVALLLLVLKFQMKFDFIVFLSGSKCRFLRCRLLNSWPVRRRTIFWESSCSCTRKLSAELELSCLSLHELLIFFWYKLVSLYKTTDKSVFHWIVSLVGFVVGLCINCRIITDADFIWIQCKDLLEWSALI